MVSLSALASASNQNQTNLSIIEETLSGVFFYAHVKSYQQVNVEMLLKSC